MSKEIWKDVVGLEGYYKISTFGRVKSLPRIVANHSKGTGRTKAFFRTRKTKGRFISIQKHYQGYLSVRLGKDSKYNWFLVHRLIAQAFIPNYQNKPHINHMNGIKNDNRIKNLEWCTNLENQRHAWRTKLRTYQGNQDCEKNNNTKLKNKDVVMMRLIYKTGLYLHRELAALYNISTSCVSLILKRKTWKDIDIKPLKGEQLICCDVKRGEELLITNL